MSRIALRILVVLAVLTTEIGAGTSPSFRRVVIVVFENTNYADAIKQPFFNRLSKEGANLTNFTAEVHPSQGNYIALTAGSAYRIFHDSEVNLDVTHIGDLLEDKGLTWKVYADAYPGECFLGMWKGTYARKHNPFASFVNVQQSPERCARMVNGDLLERDVARGELPDYSLFIPDMNNDGHDTSVAFADAWYAKRFAPLLNDGRFMDGTLLITTFDESRTWLGNHIYTSLYGPMIRPGSTSNEAYSHYSILRTIEDVFGLESLERNDKTALPFKGVWK